MFHTIPFKDIQEYYELTLLNEAKSLEEKTQETNQVLSTFDAF